MTGAKAIVFGFLIALALAAIVAGMIRSRRTKKKAVLKDIDAIVSRLSEIRRVISEEMP